MGRRKKRDAAPSLRANGSGECPPDDRFREAIQCREGRLDCFVASLLAMTINLCSPSVIGIVTRNTVCGFLAGLNEKTGDSPWKT